MSAAPEMGKFSAEERKAILLERVNAQGRVVANAMAEEFGVSEDSVRRDLRDLSEAGLVQRFHGGAAKLLAAPVEFLRRQTIDSAEKKSVGTAAAALIPDNATLLLDSSTTVLHFVRQLSASLKLRIVTSAVDIAAAALDHPTADVILLGGRLNRHTRSAVDAHALAGFTLVRADICILGTCGVDSDLTVRADDFEDAYLKSTMVQAAARTILLTTSDKLRKVAPYLVAPIAAISTIVTDKAEPDFADRIRDAGVELVVTG